MASSRGEVNTGGTVTVAIFRSCRSLFLSGISKFYFQFVYLHKHKNKCAANWNFDVTELIAVDQIETTFQQ